MMHIQLQIDRGIISFELTVVTNTRHHCTAAGIRKQDRYGPLLHNFVTHNW